MSLQAFGKRLAQLRRQKAADEERDIDRRDVAKAVNVSPSSVTRWENGEVYPGEETMQALASYFGVTPAWLRYGAGDRAAPAPTTSAAEVVAGPAPRRPRAAASPTKRQKGAR